MIDPVGRRSDRESMDTIYLTVIAGDTSERLAVRETVTLSHCHRWSLSHEHIFLRYRLISCPLIRQAQHPPSVDECASHTGRERVDSCLITVLPVARV